MVIRRKLNRGFTLFEVALALCLSGLFTAAVLIMFPPTLVLFQDLTDGENTRHEVISSLEMLGREASTMRALYVDAAKCYAVCMEYVDIADDSHHRIVYYWSSSNLMRKKELTSAGPVSCASGGQQFVGNLDTENTTFFVDRELLSVSMAALGKSEVNNYQLSAVFMPIAKEREILFTEGFECNTLAQGEGWTATNGSTSTWTIADGTLDRGHYELIYQNTVGAADTSSIAIPIDMTRYPKAVLSFVYANSEATALTSDHGLYVEWWNGTAWGTAFSHTATDDAPPTTATSIKVDLTTLGLANNSQLRFRAKSASTTAHWHIDDIRVSSP